jgi:hypothetical protein
MKELELNINHFFKAYYDWHSFITSQCKERIEGLILACTYLDSLAGYKYGKHNIKKRFANFVLNYSGQRHIYEKVSLPKLRYKLKMGEKTIHLKLLSIVEANFKLNEYYFTTRGHCVDLSVEDLRNCLSGKTITSEFEELIKIAGEFKYIDVLYEDYRCKLIHESRKPMDMNLWDSTEPYYINIFKGDDLEHTCFRIPSQFICGTLKSCIDNFKAECLRDGFDPLYGREEEGLF